ncbi:peptide/nickel transport system ATP-binding protein [Arthrobacter silviterrae]|uniref:ABC transporter ATP-binding protein n=1 Tax=Arthrobacter silviterrae TaxID=2026658 RepID=A0ABX0DAR7_9MICC|nr:ABC transporter ATP-binding protein [Arthrobacter silviterrae]MDQ0278909.1 peptide/nickel transport system ATP-binding protein [Arthrobacter silviterrae]NGN84012.1 ABC transporter ATP-binding protein [Arthrobacter silviterrae]
MKLETVAEIAHRIATSPPLLEAKGLCVDYVTEAGNIRACDDINITLHRGEILGIAGESASGKSTLLAALGRLQRAPAVTSAGQVVFHAKGKEPVDLTRLSEEQLVDYRWSGISIVMQSAMACLNPVSRLKAQFLDVLLAHDSSLTKATATARAEELLQMVGIPSHRINAFPHELSGGMQQRALIALSLACDPELVLMDEPTTAVDVVMQRQILAKVLELQEKLGFAIAFVTHDLSLLLEISDRIAIMYGGKIVEVGTAAQMYEAPRHPYTQGLRNAFPPLTEPVRKLTGIPGSPPNLLNLPQGCAFAPRCSQKIARCESEIPALLDISGGRAACHLLTQEIPEPAKEALNA